MKPKLLIAALFFSGLIYAQQAKQDSAKTKDIEAVTITKQVFKKQSDRLVYDVAASPVAKGNNAFSLLKVTPMVISTDDKTLKIAGKNNAVIYINGRKSNMNADSLVEFLKNTPAENIQKIEVITTPGSEFQVESSDGIINIILKKRMSDGLNGNLRMVNSDDYYNNTSAGVSLNYRKGKFGLSTNINTSENIRTQYYELNNGNINDNISTMSSGYIKDPNKNLGGYLNMDYELNDKSNLALQYNSWNNRSYNSEADLYNTISNNGAMFYSRTYSKDNSRSYNNSLNLNYELKTDSLGSKLNLNVAYLNFKRFGNSQNDTYSPPYINDTYLTSSIRQSTPQVINNISFLGDYTKNFKKDFSLAVGGNYNYTKTDNNVMLDALAGDGNYVPDSDLSKHFVYNENIFGVYLTANKKFSEKFSAKVGSRYEYTKSEGTVLNDNQSIERNYGNLLPYASISYAPADNHSFSYTFSSRVRRPSFWEINPVRNYLTNTNYTQNNPFVKASPVYNQEFNYMYKNAYYINIGYSQTNDNIAQVPLQKKETVNGEEINILRYIRTNFGKKYEINYIVGMNKSFFKQYLQTNINLGIQMNKVNGTLDTDPITGEKFPEFILNRTTYSPLIQANNNIRLDKAKSWFFGVNYFYIGKQQIDIGMLKPLQSLDLSIKKVWNNWTFAADARDILRTNIVKISDTQSTGNFNNIYQIQYDNRSYTATITYNFGNNKVKKIRDIENASDAIKNRTR